MKTRLFVAALVAVAVMFGVVPVQAEEPRVWDPAASADFLQPGYNIGGGSNKFHLTLFGVHASPFRLGRFRLPTLGLDFQARVTRRSSDDYIWSGHWLATAGISFVVKNPGGSARNGPYSDEEGIHAKAFYDLRDDLNPRVGRWGVTVGYYVKF